MTIHYRDYKWKNGIPYGIGKCDPIGATYKIPMDPYRKRISIEEYQGGAFVRLIYDSQNLDFRRLKPEHQMAWEKMTISDTLAEIRDQDDRLLFREEYQFEKGLCRSCRLISPTGHLLSTHRMFYTALGDPFNGVLLTDITGRPVLSKTYEVDDDGLFTTLLEENGCIEEGIAPSLA